jgi:ATP-dependent DNA helicase RecQ
LGNVSASRTLRSQFMLYDYQRALELLRQGTRNVAAEFREDQARAIQHMVEGRSRLLVVQKTGWGKSFVYFIATKLLREQGAGPALLVSPLLALMRNQIEAAERMSVRACSITSENQENWSWVESQLLESKVDILLISPERLANDRFKSEILARIASRIGLLVIDEAHCISDWGHDFRPHYRLIERIAKGLPSTVRLLATTATANNRVVDDLNATLGPNLTIIRGDLGRPSLTLQTIKMPSQAERLAWLAEQLPKIPGSGIIYTLTIRDAALVSDWLRSRGFAVASYTGQSEDRPKLEQDLIFNRVKALIATTALGMGFDKPDLGFVIHFQSPSSVVAYYQQVGRAGRALPNAYGVLLSGEEETEIADYFIETAFPTRKVVEEIIAALGKSKAGLSRAELQNHVNATAGHIDKALQLLSLESPSPVLKDGSKWLLTLAPLADSFWQRADRLTSLRRIEQEQMRQYVRLTAGHMDFLIHALDGPPALGATLPLPPLATAAGEEIVRQAIAFLRRTSLPLEARRTWPPGGLPVLNVSGKIPADRRAQPGRALAIWGDAGWGQLVRRGKYRDGKFSDELVTACLSLIRDWRPTPQLTWVTCIPSRRHPNLVPHFAQRLAAALGLPFHVVLQKTDDRPEQKTMANSSMQARNLDGSLAILPGPIPVGPVLLVDDMRDSGWTFTVAAHLLQTAGSGVVFPLALALTSGADE